MSCDLGHIMHLTNCLTMQVTKIWQQHTSHGATKLQVWTWASVTFSQVEKNGCGKTLYSKMSNLNSAIPQDCWGCVLVQYGKCNILILCQRKMFEFPSLAVRLNLNTSRMWSSNKGFPSKQIHKGHTNIWLNNMQLEKHITCVILALKAMPRHSHLPCDSWPKGYTQVYM